MNFLTSPRRARPGGVTWLLLGKTRATLQYGMPTSKDVYRTRLWRFGLVGVLLIVIGLSHWTTPTAQHHLHAVHVVLRKLFILSIALAALWFELRGAVLAAGVATILFVPHVLLHWQGRPIENVNQVGEIATMWIAAILFGLLVQKEKNALREVGEAHLGALMALVCALDAREHNTELHSLRVSEYALRIGRELSMPEPELPVLGQAALLHDVGKIGTPDHILLKPGPLTEDEWRVMRQHPETGCRILRSVPFLRQVRGVVYSHHERYDGSGYPEGLRGEQIPRAARVFAVADAFDAMTSDRPYRERAGCEKAREEIAKDAGTAFDPQVVKAFLRVPCEEWDHIRRRTAGHPAGFEGVRLRAARTA